MQKILFIFFLSYWFTVSSQNISVKGVQEDESTLYAQTKQLNQFIRRFNGEEDVKGTRYYPKDRQYRSKKLRKNYIDELFDNEGNTIKSTDKSAFVQDILDKGDPEFLDFHGGEWFAELSTTFLYKNNEEEIILYLKLQEEKVGSKWVFDDVYFPKFQQFFKYDSTSTENIKFLHPLSHELDFMNLRKAFDNPSNIEIFAKKEHKIDYLSLFLYEIKKGNLTFKEVRSVKFHFFQLDNWYFEVKEHTRPGFNSGWLISNLIKVDNKQKNDIINFIYHHSN